MNTYFHPCKRFLSPPTFSLLKNFIFFCHRSCQSLPLDPIFATAQPPDFSPTDFSTISNLLANPIVSSGPSLDYALDSTGVEPGQGLVQALFDQFDSSPKLQHALFRWSERRGIQSSSTLFDSVVNALAKSREFDSAWLLVLDRIEKNEGRDDLVCGDTFAILIRRYSRAGMVQPAIRTFEFACSIDLIRSSDSEIRLFEILLDSLCKEDHAKEATEFFHVKKEKDPTRFTSIRVYNILLNGWFRARKLKKAEKLWLELKKSDIKPTIVTYGTLVEGYCRMGRVETAIDLVEEMKTEGIPQNAVVYNPIVDALAEEGRFKEALATMERFFVSDSVPTISTYNSLVKGFCKAGDLEGASKILKMMTSRGFLPTPTTYNYYFRYFSKNKKIEESMNLYTKMIETGYNPDRLTYHLLVKMLCEDERLDLAIQVRNEMRVKGYDIDLAASTMLIHLLCRTYKFEEAFLEFEDMIRRGIVPQYLTFRRLHHELKKRGMIDLARKLADLMSSVPHSKKLPDTFKEDVDIARARRANIIQKARVMSDVIKTCKNPRKLVNHRSLSEKATWSAKKLIEQIDKRVNYE